MAKAWGDALTEPERPRKSWSWSTALRSIVPLLGFWLLLRNYIISADHTPQWHRGTDAESKARCHQLEPLFPSKSTKELNDTESYLQSEDFRKLAIERLSGAVQIPTQSYDDMGDIGADPRWDIFNSFADYLAKTFPLTHATIQLEKVNTHGLLYTWPGTDPSLKATLLMAHQDVVPVPDSTVKQWTHPPFSGYYDGKFVWGRGASDCKNQLLAILNAVEALLAADFTPRRTLILSFGFDEEISGREGAQHLAKHLLQKYGHNSIAAIVDEGAANVENWGADFAIPGVAEKGYIDVDVVVRMPGGHSSVPPVHNGIGVAAELITLIEHGLYEPRLAEENPYLGLLTCGAEHAPEFPKKLHHLLDKRSARSQTCKERPDRLAEEAAKAGLSVKYLFTTSVAVDIIHGGVKNNALPERTQIIVNHRINVGSSSNDIKTHISKLAGVIAKKYSLKLNAFNGTEEPSSITLSHRTTVLEPAPVTPTTLHSSSSNSTHVTPFSILSGTTRALYGKDLIVAPGIMTGNTDTRYYWDLSEHIFRYAPGWDKEQAGMGNIHTVDERVGVQAHLDTVKWMWGWIRNMDEAGL
ncbi:carboxypeptidase S [Macroventuria anomochaeta]|uniref:Carboxypeptidase S n=1 Tax=Macroventuria anomochaeta TaxID=301207 RepID=A0ACB6RWN3_9PLEO|nr:carboxypeptidase S [Macroventuria anomochaeta]KAF2626143.1 carboxypeptidase S [Macroventuria anomochaeta]